MEADTLTLNNKMNKLSFQFLSAQTEFIYLHSHYIYYEMLWREILNFFLIVNAHLKIVFTCFISRLLMIIINSSVDSFSINCLVYEMSKSEKYNKPRLHLSFFSTNLKSTVT